MTDYLVFNDQTGEFCAADSISAVVDSVDGSTIFLKRELTTVHSPLKPRELLRRLTIMRYKRENGETSTQARIEYGKANKVPAT